MHKGLVDKNQILAIAVVSLISTMLLSIGFAATVNVTAQPGSMATLQNIPATYAVSIVPGAAQRESPYHYFPPAIAIPVQSTVAWFNNDFGQPHTVTSGAPNASDDFFIRLQIDKLLERCHIVSESCRVFLERCQMCIEIA